LLRWGWWLVFGCWLLVFGCWFLVFSVAMVDGCKTKMQIQLLIDKWVCIEFRILSNFSFSKPSVNLCLLRALWNLCALWNLFVCVALCNLYVPIAIHRPPKAFRRRCGIAP
jgi:hypothetical protein